MDERVIYTFWEPKGQMTPYLRLCTRTWAAHIPHYRVVVLDYETLGDHFDTSVLNLDGLVRLPLQVQKDAIMVAVLQARGGLFMDVDTLVFRDIAPILRKLRDTELLMFNTLLGFVAARPRGGLLTDWLERLEPRLARLSEGSIEAEDTAWDYLGNAILTDLMEDRLAALPLAGPLQAWVVDGCRRAALDARRWPGRAARLIRAAAGRVGNSLIHRRRRLVFGTVLRRQLRMLDRQRHGFTQEVVHHGWRGRDPVALYRRFWFEEPADLERVLESNPRVVGLHNAWTPRWYKALPEEQVLAHDCLLPRTLRHLLD